MVRSGHKTAGTVVLEQTCVVLCDWACALLALMMHPALETMCAALLASSQWIRFLHLAAA
jgi:hypothetical protein